MTELDERLRAELRGVADTVTVPLLPSGPAYRSLRGRRQRPFLAIAAAAAAVALVIAGVAVVASGRPTGVPAAQGGPAAWPTRGSLAADTSLLSAAVRTWDAAPVPATELPHHDVHVLYAEHSVAGDTVVLTGVDALGASRYAWLNTDATSTTAFRQRLHLVADVLAPDGGPAGLIGLYGWRPTPRPSNDHVVIAIAAPGAPGLQWHDDVTGWHDIPTRNGAGIAVEASRAGATNVFVRSGRHGGGVRTVDEPFLLTMGMGSQIDHDLDPSEEPPDTSTCSGNVCSASAGAGSSITVGGRGGGWSDLRQSPGIAFNGPNGTRTTPGWDEFASEALLMTESRHASGGYTFHESWSALLSDQTGLYLLDYASGSDPEHLMLYVDRPEWFGGRLGADVTTTGSDPVPALAALVPGQRGTDLAVIETDGLRAQWRTGQGPWHDIAARQHVAVADVTGVAATSITYRVLDASGTTVASGTPYAGAMR